MFVNKINHHEEETQQKTIIDNGCDESDDKRVLTVLHPLTYDYQITTVAANNDNTNMTENQQSSYHKNDAINNIPCCSSSRTRSYESEKGKRLNSFLF